MTAAARPTITQSDSEATRLMIVSVIERNASSPARPSVGICDPTSAASCIVERTIALQNLPPTPSSLSIATSIGTASCSATSAGIALLISVQPSVAATWVATTLPPDPKVDETVMTGIETLWAPSPRSCLPHLRVTSRHAVEYPDARPTGLHQFL